MGRAPRMTNETGMIRGRIARADPTVSPLQHAADAEGWQPYRYRGRPDWTPGDVPEISADERARHREVLRAVAGARVRAARNLGLPTYPRALVRAAELDRKPLPGKPIKARP
jgi:hypothetical protein